MPKRAVPSWPFEVAPFFVLRTPLLGLDEIAFLGSADELGRAGSKAAAPDAAPRSDRSALVELLTRPEVREAIAVASSSLASRIDAWIASPATRSGAKTEAALLRYVQRMAFRPTPFGLLAGFTRGRVAAGAGEPSVSTMELAPRARYVRRVRLDMGACRAVADLAAREPTIREAITFAPNDAMYFAGGRWQMPRVVDRGEERRYEQLAVTSDEALERALARAHGGASLEEIGAALVSLDVSRDEARAYVDELVEAGVLVATTGPSVTGDDALAALSEAARGSQGGGGSVGALIDEARALVREVDGGALGDARGGARALDDAPAAPDPEEAYDAIRRVMRDLELPEPARAHALQIDLVKPAVDVTLRRDVVSELERGAQVLHALFGQREDPPSLVAWRRAFVRRYETRVVPLVEALDDELGIGFREPRARTLDPSPLLDGLGLPVGDEASFPDAGWSPTETLLLEKVVAAAHARVDVVEIDDADVRRVLAARGDPLPLPDSFAALASVEGSPPRVVWTGLVGPSAARLFGRFCAWDEALAEDARAHLRAEEALRPDAVFAEIVHLPDGSRAGNVLVRPVLRPHEIAIGARGGAAEEGRIPLADLLVTVRDDRVVLASKRLGREVIPRLSSAHDTTHRQLPAYRFLCRLQEQGVSAMLGFDWGRLSTLPSLPRVVHGRSVLSPARYRLDARAIAAFGAAEPAARLAAAANLRASRALPRHVALEDGDNLLPVDLESSLSVDAFSAAVRARPSVVLVEATLDPQEAFARGPEGRFRAEIVVPFSRRAAASHPSRATRPSRLAASTVTRHAPGGEWLYVKLYQGRQGADRALDACVRPVVAKAIEDGVVDRFFFVRYADPQPHLRVRLRARGGAAARLLSEVLPSLHARAAPLLASGLLGDVQLGTYEPETERYGGEDGLSLAEQIFHADSVAALTLLPLGARALEPPRARWGLALASMDALALDVGLTPAEHGSLLASIRSYFADEMKIEGERERGLDRRFREERAFCEAVLGAAPPSPFDAAGAIFAARSAKTRPLFAALRELERSGRLGAPLEDVVASLIHMSNNRLLHADPRQHEAVLASFLERVYLSRAARARER